MAEIKKQEKNTVFFDITLNRNELRKAEDKVYKKNRNYFQIPGFRKGKAPKAIIENMYGKDIFLEDAINEILPEKYEEIVKELNLDVVSQPTVDIEEIKKDEDVVVNISVDIKPEIEVKDYKGVEVENVEYLVTDELLDSEFENQRKMNARIKNIDDRAAKIGDKVNIDFHGTIDGEAFDGGHAHGQDLELGSNTFIKGFEEQIVGKNVGDEFDVVVTFPEDYFEERLRGKEATFKVNLNSISEEELPELDDEFIKDISDFDTVKEYREDLKIKKEEELKNRAEAEKEAKVLDKVVDSVEVDIPKSMVDAQINAQVENFDRSLKMQGFGIDQYVKMLGQTMEDFKENLRKEAEKQVKTALVIEAIAKAENFEITDTEIEEEVDKSVKEYFKDNEEQQEKMKKLMLESNREAVIDNLEQRKVIDFLVENAKFVEAKEEKEEKEKKPAKKTKKTKKEEPKEE